MSKQDYDKNKNKDMKKGMKFSRRELCHVNVQAHR